MRNTPHTILQDTFGHTHFKPGQLKIINSIIAYKDILAILPTGAGKSLCFQIPGLILGGTTIVISPLISLMKDQVDKLNTKGIISTFINSSLSSQEVRERLELTRLGRFSFVYVAPERLLTKSFLDVIKSISIKLLVIDEAHCISQWGHDFRPEYRLISKFTKALTKRPTIAAFTATATTNTQKDIQESLTLNQPKIFRHSFYRPQLYLNTSTYQTQLDREYQLFRILKKHSNQAGVIYTATRKKAEYLCTLINHFNFHNQYPTTAFYHAGLGTKKRTKIQEKFVKDKIQVIAATNAFGMGIDKPNIRFVIHFQLPSTIEHYYQEIGRAGRDGKKAWCYLLAHHDDLSLHQQTDKQLSILKLKKMAQYTTQKHCRFRMIRSYFGESIKEDCQHCSYCCSSIKTQSSEKKENLKLIILKLRKKLAKEYGCQPSNILTKNQAKTITLHQPQTKADYLKLPGIGTGWVEEWYDHLRLCLSETNKLVEKGGFGKK